MLRWSNASSAAEKTPKPYSTAYRAANTYERPTLLPEDGSRDGVTGSDDGLLFSTKDRSLLNQTSHTFNKIVMLFSFVFEGRQQSRTRGRQDRPRNLIVLLFLMSTTLYFISKYFAGDFPPNNSPAIKGGPLPAPSSTPVSPVHRDYQTYLLRKRRDRSDDRESNGNLSAAARPRDIEQLTSPTSDKGFSTHSGKVNEVGSPGIAWGKKKNISDLDAKSLNNGDDAVPTQQTEIDKPSDAPLSISTNVGDERQPLPQSKDSHELQGSGVEIIDSNDNPVDSDPSPKGEELYQQAEYPSFTDDKAYLFHDAKRHPGSTVEEFYDINREKSNPTSLQTSQNGVMEEDDDILRGKTQSTAEDVESNGVFTRTGTFDIIDEGDQIQGSHTKTARASQIGLDTLFSQNNHLHHQDVAIAQKARPSADEGEPQLKNQESEEEVAYSRRSFDTQQILHLTAPKESTNSTIHSHISTAKTNRRRTRDIGDQVYEESSGEDLETTEIPVQDTITDAVWGGRSTIGPDVEEATLTHPLRVTGETNATATLNDKEATVTITENTFTSAHADVSEVLEYTGSAHYRRGMRNGVTDILRGGNTMWKPLGTPRYHNNWFVVLDFHVSYTMKKLRIVNYGCDWIHDVKAFTLQVSIAGNPYRWTPVLTVTDVAANTSLPQYFGGFSASGRYWMVTVTTTYSGWEPWIRTFQLFGIKGCRKDVVPNIMLPLKAEICCVPDHIDWNPEPELSGLQCSNTASCRVCGSMTGNSCGCDKACRTFGDCCHNYEYACGDDVTDDDDIRPVIQPNSCKGRCNVENVASKVTCSCTSSCNLTDTCCDDFEDGCQGGNVTIIAQEIDQPLQCVAPWDFRSHFWMVASCPPSFADDVVRGMCETSYENDDMFLHAPVTDNSTNTNYRNVFCALCNNARYMVGWKMVAKCGYTPSNPLKTILQDKNDICDHYFRPTVAPVRLCFPPHTKPPRASVRCDVAKCRNITAVFYANARPFRNSACAECYADEDDLFDTSCKADDTRFIGFLGTITVLFDYSDILHSKLSSNELQVFDHTESCSMGFIYDPFRDTCRKISFVTPTEEVPKDAGVTQAGESLENDHDDHQAPTQSPIEELPTQNSYFPQQSATFLVINTVSGASAVVSILYLLSGLRRFAGAESAVKICLLTSLLLAQISQLLGQVVPSAACCTAMLVCTLCFCLAASLSLTATIQHLSVLQRGGTCKAAAHLLVIVVTPLAMSGGYVALDDSIRMGAPRPLASPPFCWIDDPAKMAITMVVPLVICTLVDLYYLLCMSMTCATTDGVQYSSLALGVLLFVPFTAAMTTGVMTAYFDSELLRTAFLYMVISLDGVVGFLFLVFSIVGVRKDDANVVVPPLPSSFEALSDPSFP
uniref:SMB domain-containing protein n=1 Tax=Branchiostoma floridae TaxID=7739 RepID=C3ZH66_BRAFL|eukprot:XP_002592202.1 hypothetical protein BRAFLDRAFT_84628 [Branchiostoma floridae]